MLSGSLMMAGIAISFVSFAVALYLLHRLVTIELGGEHARTAVLVLAFFPTALFFSAVYPESLLLALTIGAVYAARTGHWAWAGVLGAFASSAHNSGVLVAIPIALLYLYGPRADRERPPTPPAGRWRPRYRPRLDLLWLALVPLGLVAFFAYMGIAHGDALLPLHVNDTIWHRHFSLLGGITGVAGVVWHGFHTVASAPPDQLFPATNGPYRAAAINMVDAAALLFALVATIGVVRRLPFAYSAYSHRFAGDPHVGAEVSRAAGVAAAIHPRPVPAADVARGVARRAKTGWHMARAERAGARRRLDAVRHWALGGVSLSAVGPAVRSRVSPVRANSARSTAVNRARGAGHRLTRR